MKTKQLQLFTAALTAFIFVTTGISQATIRTVTVSNFSFTPANISCSVGDTIKWTWSSGGHTTTCNGSSGSTRPVGAPGWNQEINNNNPTYSYVITIPGLYHYVCLPHAPEMAGNINASPSSITQLTEIVNSYELSQNYPNPFNPVTNIHFSVPSNSYVSLKIFNNAGQEVETLVNEKLNAGSYKVDWNAVNFTSGVYFYKIEANDFVLTKKMLLIK